MAGKAAATVGWDGDRGGSGESGGRRSVGRRAGGIGGISGGISIGGMGGLAVSVASVA